MEWFVGDPELKDVPVKVVHRMWRCPINGCTGEMKYTGVQWPTGDPGFHHKCTECGYEGAIRGGAYPRIEHLATDQTGQSE